MADNPYAQFVTAPAPSVAAPAAPPTNPYSQFVTAPAQPQQADVPVIDVGGSSDAPVGQPGSQYAPSNVGGGGTNVGTTATVPAQPATQNPQTSAGNARAPQPQTATPPPPGAQLIAPPQIGAPAQGPSLIQGNPQPQQPQPQGGAWQGASDAAFAALDAIPGASQLGAATDAALGYVFGQGSQAQTFGQRYQENLKANAARLQSIPAALRIPAEITGAIPAMAVGGAGVGALADAASAAIPAVAPTLNALSSLPSILRFAGAGAAQGAVQGASDAPTNADIVPNALTGAALGAASGAALPTIGNAVGGAVRAVGEYASPMLGRAAPLTDKAGNVVMGQNGQPIMATPNQARLAGQQLTQAATDPLAARSALAGGPNEIIPGSVPTTAQQTGDLGLLSLERAKATQYPDKFAGVRESQNAAQRQVVTKLQGNGDPMAVVNTVRARRAAIDQTAQQNIDQLRSTRDASTTAIGGDYDPEAAGSPMREPILANEEAARAHEAALHAAVDPDGTLAVDATPVRAAARQIIAEQTPSARPLSSAENQMFNVAAGYKPLVSYRELSQLSENLNSAMREELAKKGRTPSYARLSRFRAALESAMDGSLEHQAAAEAQAVADGRMSPEETIAARLNEDVADWRKRRSGETLARGNSAEDTGKRAPQRGVGGVPGVERATPSGPWGYGNPASDSGLAPEQTALEANWDQAAQQRRLTANAATKDRVATYNKGFVGQITQRAEASDALRLSDARVPDTILRTGPAGLDALHGYEKAGGDMNAARDALAMKARQIAVKADGSLDQAALARFRKGYTRVLSDPSMKPLNDALASAEGAETMVADAAARVKQQSIAENRSAAARFMGAASSQDVANQIGTMFGNNNSGALFRQLKTQIGNDKDATAGVRRAIIAHIESKFIGNTEVGASGQTGMRADQFQTFMRENHDALGQFFSDNEVRTMGLLGLDLRRAARSIGAVKIPGSPGTAQDTFGTQKYSLLNRVAQKVFSPDTAAIIGGEGGGFAGIAAGVAIGATKEFVNAMRNAGLSKIDDLVTEAMLHPEVARILMSKVTPETEPRILRALSHAVTRAAAVNFAGQAAQ